MSSIDFVLAQTWLRICCMLDFLSLRNLFHVSAIQEFDSREAAEQSVAKYNEGTFKDRKIRVELSRGGGRTAKFSGDPGACFRCGLVGHWARLALGYV
jgi:hypothetical protein